ncbi:Flp pilus assembly protein CpaB [Sphingobium chlorophenolicum L-1]|uniref:Flp pilus assembly protein CpaB n=1 Tax=Sphingobium chlorophenolicum L-1 TaxID=690566 RepID=F6F315_SPHCR|nr:Flp pilus assembly protein CpaB [Sphingobium chlorophenolicum]AEG50827.1 Flp pilus assembly protein CpaB [Sphingobium chlorophenolicum L-1]
MRLGLKAKLTIGVGLTAATAFLALGVRELRKASAATGENRVTAPAKVAAPTVLLVQAARAIRTGETITADMIRNAAGDPARFPQAATSAEVVGKVATRDIAMRALIARDAVGVESNLAMRVPMGMRAVSIDTTAEIAVAGLVRPGDRVDVQVVYPGADAISGARGAGRSRAQALLQMVQVLAVGEVVVGARQASGVEGALASPPLPARTVTLALTPEQVSALSLAKNIGALTLSLRNPADSAQVAVAVAASAGGEAAAPAAARVVVTPAPAPRVLSRPAAHAIELVVGERRETIYSGSGTR